MRLRRVPIESAVLFVLLLTAAALPSRALTLSVVPAQPVAGTQFTLVIGLEADCAAVNGVVVSPAFTTSHGRGEVTATLLMGCPSPPPLPQPRPFLLEVPIGPLAAGLWDLRVALPNTLIPLEVLKVDVRPLPYRIELDPPSPQAGNPFTLRLSGFESCVNLGVGFTGPVVREGNVLSVSFNGNCVTFPPPPESFTVEQSIEPLPADDYVIHVTGFFDEIAASHRFHVFGPDECRPSQTTLCLQNGRFHVEAAWRTKTAAGVARVNPETADSGSLWFFSPTNLEMLVKVLDACQTPRPAFWVFAAGLTDVEVELFVTDMVTKQTRTYRNLFGKPFAPILDTSAFSC